MIANRLMAVIGKKRIENIIKLIYLIYIKVRKKYLGQHSLECIVDRTYGKLIIRKTINK